MYLTLNATDSITINLKKNGLIVATALVNTDLRHRSLIWREKVTADSTFEISLKRTGSATGTVTILKNNFQWSFQTFGPNYVNQITAPAA